MPIKEVECKCNNTISVFILQAEACKGDKECEKCGRILYYKSDSGELTNIEFTRDIGKLREK